MYNSKSLRDYVKIATDYCKAIKRQVEDIKNKKNKPLFSSGTIEKMWKKQKPENVTPIGNYMGKETPKNVETLYESKAGKELEIG